MAAMADAPALEHQIGGLQQGHPDLVITALADAQHGVVSRTQLLAAGLTRRHVERRIQRSLLRVVHRGVYAVGHRALAQEAIWMAAVLAAGEGAVLSHWSAASLWRLRQGRGPRSHVTCRRARRDRHGIAFHEAELAGDEVTVERGIPVTTAARTALDLAPSLPGSSLARMIAATQRSAGPSLAELLDRYPRRPGTPKLRAIIAGPIARTRSDLEAEWLERIERAGLPRPDVNIAVEGYEADFVWYEERVIAELDTYVTHGSPLAFERDRERDRKLTAAGWRVVRVTDRQTDDALGDLSRLLAASAARSPRRRAWAA
jgi:very-short-patch-repair endonuclease